MRLLVDFAAMCDEQNMHLSSTGVDAKDHAPVSDTIAQSAGQLSR